MYIDLVNYYVIINKCFNRLSVSMIYLNVHEEEVMIVPSFLHHPVEEHRDFLLLENQKQKNVKNC